MDIQELLLLACDIEDLQKESAQYHTVYLTTTPRPKTQMQAIESGSASEQTSTKQGRTSGADDKPNASVPTMWLGDTGIVSARMRLDYFAGIVADQMYGAWTIAKVNRKNSTGLHQ